MKSVIVRNYVYVAVFVANIISFIAGTSLTWSSPILPKLNGTEDNPLGRITTDSEQSWIGSLLAIGAIFGPFLFGIAADKVGRKWTILALGVPFLAAYLIMAFAKIIELFYFSRVLVGLGVGGVFTIIPMYTGELAEDSNRGTLGAAMNCFVTAGLLFSYVLGPYLSFIIFHILLAVFPAAFLILLVIFSPESPHYLVNKDIGKAEDALKMLRGVDDVSAELEEIKHFVEISAGGSFKDMYQSRGTRKAFIISLGLILFQQFSGINVILFYGQEVISAAGGDLPAAVGPIIIGIVQFAASFATPIFSDKSGRKILLIISHSLMFLSEIPFAVYFFLSDGDKNVSNITWLPILCLVIYIMGYNVASGGLPWAVMGEVFPSNIKSTASSTMVSICWLFGFIITQYFSVVRDAIGMGPTFSIFAGCCLLGVVFIHFYVIETKGKSLQEIQDELNS